MSAWARATRWVAGRSTLFMSLSVVVGLLAQDLARALSPLVLFASMSAMFLTALRIDRLALTAWLRRPFLPVAIIVFTTLLLPGLTVISLSAASIDPTTALAIGLIIATPPIISVGAYCVFLGTDNELLTLSVLPATALGIVTLPVFAEWFGLPGLTPTRLAIDLLLVVGTAMGGAALIRMFVPLARVEQHAASLDFGAVVTMVVVAIGVTDGLSALIAAQPGKVVEAFAVTALLSVVLQALAWLVFARFGARAAASVALVNGFRNMALLLGLLIGRVEAPLQLLLVAGQLQLFLLPVLMRPLYRRLGVHPAGERLNNAKPPEGEAPPGGTLSTSSRKDTFK